MQKEVHFYVVGRVQGVGYRRWCQRIASKMGLSGWVRNRADGSVEVKSIGDSLVIDAILKSCLEGPSWARVDKLIPVAIPSALEVPILENEFQILSTK